MKSALLLLAAALATSQPTQPPASTQPSVAPAPAPSAIQAIGQAPDPSATIEAYARGIAANPNDTALEQAYVHHMVALGAPEMADAQAHDLVKRGAADALTMGVAAYGDAQRGQIPAAVSNLKSAVALDADNPFILRTAAQVVVWYDTSPDRSMLSKDDVAGIETLRSAGNNKPEFGDAYRMAFDARQRARQEQQQESAATQPTTPYITDQPYTSSAPTTYYYSGAPYAVGVGGGGGDYYPYYYPYYGYAFWPGSILILHDHDFHHHHHFHDGFVHDGVRGGFVSGGDAIVAGGRNGGFVAGDGIIVGHDTTFPRPHRSSGSGTVIMGPQLLDHTDGVRSDGGGRGVMGPMPAATPAPAPSGHSGSAAVLRQGPAPSAPSAPARAASPAPAHSSGGGSSSSSSGGRR